VELKTPTGNFPVDLVAPPVPIQCLLAVAVAEWYITPQLCWSACVTYKVDFANVPLVKL
jgi:hypothetical protein